MKKRLTVLAIVASLFLLFVWATPALAVSDPDSISMPTCKVFQNIFEDDDMLFLISYEVEYTVEPDEPASSTFLMTIYDTDGTTEILSRPLNYYQYNIHSVYFDATAAASLVWESEYVVRVMGNPVYFVTLTEDVNQVSTTLSPSSWVAGSMSSSRLLLRQHCLDLAADLEEAWVITLIISTPDGEVLNSTGYIVFTDAIPGISSAIPSLFQMASSTIIIEDVDSTAAYSEELGDIGDQLGTTVENAFDGIGNYLGISGQMVAAAWVVLFMLIAASIVFLNSGSTAAAMALVIPIAILGVAVGVLPMAALFTVGAIIVVYMAYFIWLRGM